MTDHIEALERLQKLRESGAITEAEFELEKERLLRPPAAAAPRPPSWIWIAGGAAAILLVALLVILLLRRESGTEGNETASANLAVAPAPETNLVAPAPVETGIRTRPQAEQLAAAFRAAFGRDRRATRTVDSATMTYTPGGLRWIGDRAVLVSPGRSSETCHACAGALAVHYLEAQGDGFRVAGEWLNGGGGADWGAAPEWRFSTELSDQPMLRTDTGGGGQGVFCSRVNFHEFGAGGPREVATVPTGMSNTGVSESGGTEIEGRIANVRKNQSFDVVFTGTERFTEHYVMRAGHYALASGESRATC
jgi:putative oligomerization/nucleic acid binding protein